MTQDATATRRGWFAWAAVLALFLDQLTKVTVYNTLGPGESMRLLGDVVRLVRAANPQGVFGISFGPRFMYFLMPLLGAALVTWLGFRTMDRWQASAYGIILGGAVGNLVDRVRLGGRVIDFIDAGVRGWRWYTFNLADAFVVLGIVLLLVREVVWRPIPAGGLLTGGSRGGGPQRAGSEAKGQNSGHEAPGKGQRSPEENGT